MSRKRRKIKKRLAPDPVYKNVNINRFINKIMMSGKKRLAERTVYQALTNAAEKVSKDPLEVFVKALKNCTPQVEVKSRRVGGSTYQVPIDVRGDRGAALAMRWIIQNARAQKGRPIVDKLTSEFVDAFNGQGLSIKKKEETHKMADSNKAFAHFRW